MEWVTPSVFLIAHSVPIIETAREWIDELGFDPEAGVLDSKGVLSGPEELIAWAGKRCYNSFATGGNPNITKIRSDWTDYFENLLASGHGSVLEHASFTFAIENVSRVLTAELDRHRAGVAISEGSLRYIRYKAGHLPFVCPPSLVSPDSEKMHRTKAIIAEAVDDIETHYAALVDLWEPELNASGNFKLKKELTSLFRRILPMGIATGGIWTFNLRALRHILTMRGSEAAEEEICELTFKLYALAASVLNVGISDFTVEDGRYLRPKYVKV